MQERLKTTRMIRFPLHGWMGILLISVFWVLNWGLASRVPFTSIGFFPLWLGYCLTVDGLTYRLRATSLLTRSLRKYVGLFLVSAPVWWVFELLNWRLQNWHYVGRELFSDLEYFFLASLSFSTVIPAVFGTAELFAGASFVRNLGKGPWIRNNLFTTTGFAFAGLGMFVAMMVWPNLFFPFLWISLYFVSGAINVWLGNRSLTERTMHGDWRPVIALFLGGVTCGFFWEFWNYFSYPKWVYSVPWGGFAHVFEMPLLGYGGYLPFALELFALYHLILGLLGRQKTDYVTNGLFQTM